MENRNHISLAPGVRRTLAALALLVFMVASLPASAYFVPTDSPGGTTTNFACNPGQITISPSASAQSQYSNSLIAFKYVLVASNGYQYFSPWSGWYVAPGVTSSYQGTFTTPRSGIASPPIAAATGLTWSMAVQYVWYTPGIGYSYSQWQVASWFSTNGSNLLSQTCRT